MTQEKWTAVDAYINDRLLPADPVLNAALEASTAAGLPAYAVSPTQGKLLLLLAKMQGARNILEIGTLGGYSTIWLARGLAPGGQLVTLEASAKHADVARANIERAGFSGVVELRVGLAQDTLADLAAERRGPFDLIFIDADKENNVPYFQWALKLSRRGTVIIVDNVIRDGAIVDAANTDPSILGVRRLNELLAVEPRVTSTAIQTVGSKGYDGFLIALVTTSE
jgi:predicted O-methyltransferase YrrM